MRTKIECVTGLLFAGFAALPVEAQTAITYQGQLKAEGKPVDGMYDMLFALFPQATGGSSIGGPLTFDGNGSNPPPVTVSNGLFQVVLDFGDRFDGSARWLHVEVRPHAEGNYQALAPRQPLTATPFALYAFDGPGGAGPWAENNSDIHNTNSGNVGIGTRFPAAPLHVAGDIRSDGTTGVIAHNPTNPDAIAALGWINDTARIRVGGNGAGALGGLDIQRTGDRSMMRLLGNGNVGIGTTDPDAKLHVVGDGVEATMRITNGGGVACAGIANTGLLVSDVCGDGRAAGFYGITSNNLVTIQNDGSGNAATFAGDVTFNAGNVGIGTTAPATRLHVTGGTDTAPGGGGGYLVLGNTNGANISIDNNEIMARNNGATSTLFLNNEGGNVVVGGTLDIGIESVFAHCETASGICEASCPPGKAVLTGGCSTWCDNCGAITESRPDPIAEFSGPQVLPTRWHCKEENSTGELRAVAAWVLCARIK